MSVKGFGVNNSGTMTSNAVMSINALMKLRDLSGNILTAGSPGYSDMFYEVD